jgi:RNA ligase (TIGR02306 family)
MRQLATIQKIKNIRDIEGKDRVQVATVLGYDVIIGKGMYQEDQHVCFFEIDSLFPKDSEFWKEDLERFKYRIKTMKVNTPNGPIYGQGWCIPLEYMMKYIKQFKPDIYDKIINTNEIKIYEGLEVTEYLDITKYDPELIENSSKLLPGNAEGNFPTEYLSKSDETRLQGCLGVLEELKDHPYVIRKKYEGTSITFIKIDDRDRVCSRNLMLKKPQEGDPKSDYWDMYNKYPGIAGLLNEGFAVQAEMYGEGIMKNPLGMKGKHIAVFNIIDIKRRKYVDDSDLIELCRQYDLPICEEIERGLSFNYTYDELAQLADSQTYPNGHLCEGIVVRPQTEMYSNSLRGRLSFKQISRPYLAKEK